MATVQESDALHGYYNKWVVQVSWVLQNINHPPLRLR